MDVSWILIPGGVCRYGDAGKPLTIASLQWTTTPLTAGQLDVPGEADVPVTAVSHGEATALAARVGGRLPRSAEWEWMAAGSERRLYPWGDQPWEPDLGNLRGSGIDGPTPVTAHQKGATPDGLLDVAGNVWEWTSSSALGEGYVIRGGSFASPPLYAQCTFLNAAPAKLSSRGIGVRAVRDR